MSSLESLRVVAFRKNIVVVRKSVFRRLDSGECRRADILVAAVGRPQIVKGDWIKPGAVVIDVGINRVPGNDGKSRLIRDVDFEAACQTAGAITPVLGGVGPMIIACLLFNTLTAAYRKQDVPMSPFTSGDMPGLLRHGRIAGPGDSGD